MGRDKTALRLGARSLLGHIRAGAVKLGLPMRVIRRDLVPRCGPLGGIYTALKTSQGKAELFLACDMPFVSVGLMKSLLRVWKSDQRAVFMASQRVVGFPLLVPVEALALVERRIAKRQFSLQGLAEALGARIVQSLPDPDWELFNVNTPDDWREARQHWNAGKKRT